LKALLHEDLCQTLGELTESLGVDHNSFETFEGVRNDAEARTLGAILDEAERRRTYFHV